MRMYFLVFRWVLNESKGSETQESIYGLRQIPQVFEEFITNKIKGCVMNQTQLNSFLFDG